MNQCLGVYSVRPPTGLPPPATSRHDFTVASELFWSWVIFLLTTLCLCVVSPGYFWYRDFPQSTPVADPNVTGVATYLPLDILPQGGIYSKVYWHPGYFPSVTVLRYWRIRHYVSLWRELCFVAEAAAPSLPLGKIPVRGIFCHINSPCREHDICNADVINRA